MERKWKQLQVLYRMHHWKERASFPLSLDANNSISGFSGAQYVPYRACNSIIFPLNNYTVLYIRTDCTLQCVIITIIYNYHYVYINLDVVMSHSYINCYNALHYMSSLYC